MQRLCQLIDMEPVIANFVTIGLIRVGRFTRLVLEMQKTGPARRAAAQSTRSSK
jgi:hypothetical protein